MTSLEKQIIIEILYQRSRLKQFEVGLTRDRSAERSRVGNPGTIKTGFGDVDPRGSASKNSRSG